MDSGPGFRPRSRNSSPAPWNGSRLDPPSSSAATSRRHRISAIAHQVRNAKGPMAFSRRATQSIATCGTVTVRYPPAGDFSCFKCQERTGRARDRAAFTGMVKVEMSDIVQRFPGAAIAPQLVVDNTADWIKLELRLVPACSVDLRVNWLALRDPLPARSGFVVRGLCTRFLARDGTSGVGARALKLNPRQSDLHAHTVAPGAEAARENAENPADHGVFSRQEASRRDADYSRVQTRTTQIIPQSKPRKDWIIPQSKPSRRADYSTVQTPSRLAPGLHASCGCSHEPPDESSPWVATELLRQQVRLELLKDQVEGGVPDERSDRVDEFLGG